MTVYFVFLISVFLQQPGANTFFLDPVADASERKKEGSVALLNQKQKSKRTAPVVVVSQPPVVAVSQPPAVAAQPSALEQKLDRVQSELVVVSNSLTVVSSAVLGLKQSFESFTARNASPPLPVTGAGMPVEALLRLKISSLEIEREEQKQKRQRCDSSSDTEESQDEDDDDEESSEPVPLPPRRPGQKMAQKSPVGRVVAEPVSIEVAAPISIEVVASIGVEVTPIGVEAEFPFEEPTPVFEFEETLVPVALGLPLYSLAATPLATKPPKCARSKADFYVVDDGVDGPDLMRLFQDSQICRRVLEGRSAVLSAAQLEQCVRQAERRLGTLDDLVRNAARRFNGEIKHTLALSAASADDEKIRNIINDLMMSKMKLAHKITVKTAASSNTQLQLLSLFV